MPYNYDDTDFDEDIDMFEDLDSDEIASRVNDDVDIEKLIAAIRRYRGEVDFLKKLKKKRVEPIDAKIEKLTGKEEQLRDLILDFMPKLFPKKNTVDFPGVGKISKRKTKGKWVVTDEEEFAKTLEEHGLYDEVMKIKASVVKKKVPNAVSRIMAESEQEEVPGVVFEEPERDSSLVLKIYEPVEEDEEDEAGDDLGF